MPLVSDSWYAYISCNSWFSRSVGGGLKQQIPISAKNQLGSERSTLSEGFSSMPGVEVLVHLQILFILFLIKCKTEWKINSGFTSAF